MAKGNVGVSIDPTDLVSPEQAEIERLKLELSELRAKQPAKHEEDSGQNAASSLERYGIVIDEGNGPQDIQEVPVQVNGRAYQIRRGMFVEVPKEVVSVLNDAVIDKAVPQYDATGMPAGIKMHPTRRFPFREYGMMVDAAGKRVKEAPALAA